MTTNKITADKFGISIVLVSGDALLLLNEQEARLPVQTLLPGQTFSQPTAQVLQTDSLLDLQSQASSADKYNIYTTTENLVQNNFLPGESFFYKLSEYSNYEFGIAEIRASGNRFLLERKRIAYYFNGESRDFVSGPPVYSNPKLFLQVSPPEALEETLFFGNSVPCLSASGALSSIVLDNNTILGCKDNQIQAINAGEFGEIFREAIVDSLQEENLNLNSVRLIPSQRPINPPRGTIIYNNQFNRMEFYNGIQWVTL